MDKEKSKKKSPFDVIMSLIMTAVCVVTGIVIIINVTAGQEQTLAVNTAQETASTVNVSVETAAYSDFSTYTKLFGDIVTDSAPVAIYPDVSGEITSINVKRGDRVEQGDVIAAVDQSRPGYNYQASPVVSTVSGEVLSVDAAAGDTVQTTSSIITVLLDEELKIETTVPERYISSLALGNSSTFTVTAWPEKTYSATLSYIAPVVDTDTRTVTIELTIDEEQAGLLEGMFATVSLETERIENVITVPSSAISSDNRGQYVLTVSNGIAAKVYVETGSSDGTRTVITSGLNGGEQVITAGSASENSAVSIVEEN